MYKHFFGLRENPFNVNPDPRYLFLTPQTKQALDEMFDGIRSRKGLMLLTGEVGTGKTTLINRLLDLLHQERTPTAFIFNSHLETSHLFDFIMADFGIAFDSQLKGNALMRLNQWLIDRFRAGETPVLIVDEAQGLPIHLFEEIRMLLNLETCNEKLLQIVLSGQPELQERLKRPDLRQLKQRITLRCRTSALTGEEIPQYVESRLQLAGAGSKPVFAPEAMDAVHFYSRGIPRVVNLLCEHALINAYAEQVRPVPARIIEEIAREFQFDDVKPLGRAVDSANTPSASSIAPQSIFASGLVHTPAPTRPLVCPEQYDGASTNSGPVSFAADAFASDVSSQLIAELALERAPLANPPRLHVVEAKKKFGPVRASGHRRAFSPQTPAHPTPAANTSKSTSVTSRRITLLALCVSVARSSTAWKDRFLSAARSPARSQMTANLVQRLRRSLSTARAAYVWCVARTNKTLAFLGFGDWPRVKASAYQWLRQPCDPVHWLQRGWDPVHWRLPDSLQFEARRKLSHKKT